MGDMADYINTEGPEDDCQEERDESFGVLPVWLSGVKAKLEEPLPSSNCVYRDIEYPYGD